MHLMPLVYGIEADIAKAGSPRRSEASIGVTDGDDFEGEPARGSKTPSRAAKPR